MNSRKPRKTISFIASSVLTMGLAGCATGPTQYQALALTGQEQSELQEKPAYLQPLYQKLFEEGARNEVLNRMEIGSRAFYAGDIDEARENFDVALQRIETVYANDDNAHAARSLWHEEGRKDFKGEPYERAMVYYYRGLIYMADGEYDNARASFISGLMQDAFAEEEQNRSDLALMMLMAGWSAQKMGSQQLAEEAYDELRQLRPNYPIPKPTDNVLIVAETGKAPRKLADGVGHYEMVFRPGKNFAEKKVAIQTPAGPLEVLPLEDVYWQATSRGGRPIDAIIEGKAAFRDVNADMGKLLANLGTTANVLAPLSYSGNSMGQVGNTLALVGVAQMALAANSRPRADTRYWERLPDAVHVASYQLPPNLLADVDNWQASYSDIDGNPVQLPSGVFRHYADTNGNHIIWHASQPR